MAWPRYAGRCARPARNTQRARSLRGVSRGRPTLLVSAGPGELISLTLLLLCLQTGRATCAEWRASPSKAPGAAPGFRAEPAAPPFSIRKDAGSWWLLSPEGQRFFSMGVCCVHQGTLRSAFDPENPGYAA